MTFIRCYFFSFIALYYSFFLFLCSKELQKPQIQLNLELFGKDKRLLHDKNESTQSKQAYREFHVCR